MGRRWCWGRRCIWRLGGRGPLEEGERGRRRGKSRRWRGGERRRRLLLVDPLHQRRQLWRVGREVVLQSGIAPSQVGVELLILAPGSHRSHPSHERLLSTARQPLPQLQELIGPEVVLLLETIQIQADVDLPSVTPRRLQSQENRKRLL